LEGRDTERHDIMASSGTFGRRFYIAVFGSVCLFLVGEFDFIFCRLL